MFAATIKRLGLSTMFVALCAQGAWAQQADEQPAQKPAGEEPDEPRRERETAQGADDAKDGDDGGIQTRTYSTEADRPEPPGQEQKEAAGEASFEEVAIDAGVGSSISYASATVVELGGAFALTFQSDTTTFRITPTLGYFFMDNVELSLLPDFTVIDVDGNTDVNLGLLVEPSYHLPVSDRVFAFIGLGVGFTYASDPGADFAMRPRLGLDITVGRSGIFKPAFFLDFFAADGVERGGVEASFTVML